MIKEIELDSGLAKFDLPLELSNRTGRRIAGEHRSELFERSTIKRMASHFQKLLKKCGSEASSQIARLAILGAREQKSRNASGLKAVENGRLKSLQIFASKRARRSCQ